MRSWGRPGQTFWPNLRKSGKCTNNKKRLRTADSNRFGSRFLFQYIFQIYFSLLLYFRQMWAIKIFLRDYLTFQQGMTSMPGRTPSTGWGSRIIPATSFSLLQVLVWTLLLNSWYSFDLFTSPGRNLNLGYHQVDFNKSNANQREIWSNQSLNIDWKVRLRRACGPHV